MNTVTVIGGAGIFGQRICMALAADPRVRVRIVGRDAAAGQALARRIGAEFRRCDIEHDLADALHGAQVVVHAAGPFQRRDYRVARACIARGIHYVDLADARTFVTGIASLDEAARHAGVLVTSGASSVPAVTSALIDALRPEFSAIDETTVALSPGNHNPRGRSTLSSVLAYVGRPFEIVDNGRPRIIFGWDDAQVMAFPRPLGRRRVQACEVPDLSIFPTRYECPTVRFYAGLELDLFNRVLSAIGWLRRNVRDFDLDRWSGILLRISLLFYPLGTARGALAVWLRGSGTDGRPLSRSIALVTDRDGPATPSAPAIILARQLLAGPPPKTGAMPCVGLIDLDTLTEHLQKNSVWCVRGDGRTWEDSPTRRQTADGCGSSR